MYRLFSIDSGVFHNFAKHCIVLHSHKVDITNSYLIDFSEETAKKTSKKLNEPVVYEIHLQKGKCQLALKHCYVSWDNESIVVFEKNRDEHYVAPFNDIFFKSKGQR